ncbi:MAG: DUF4374 domain-containing protein [Capnocytophaga sp.]|nr:MAG: DUF4374 domain-containing protein [Capnocytophaga sp.]
MYINFQSIRKMLFLTAIGAATLVSCSKSDDNTNDDGSKNKSVENNGQNGQGDATPQVDINKFFIDVKGTDGNARYILYADEVASGEVPIGENKGQLKPANGYFWMFNKNIAAGLSYQFNAAGIGVAYGRNKAGEVSEIAQFNVTERATTFGFFGDYYITAVSGQTIAGEEGAKDGATFVLRKTTDFSEALNKTIRTKNLLPEMNNTEIVSFAGILDNGNGEFLTNMIVSDYKDVRPGQGSSTGVIHNPDVVYVGVFDKDLNFKRYYKSDKLGYAAGRFKSQYLLELAKTENGNVYVFSGGINQKEGSTRKAGALLIKPGATGFDPDYFFDIASVSNNGIFRRVWHISGNKFFLEFFNDAASAGLRSLDAHRYAIVDVEAKTLSWVTGLPEPANINGITSNPITPAIYQGKVYLPVNEKNTDPAIYVIDPATNAATKGLVVKGANVINAIGRFE